MGFSVCARVSFRRFRVFVFRVWIFQDLLHLGFRGSRFRVLGVVFTVNEGVLWLGSFRVFRDEGCLEQQRLPV